LEFLVHMQVTSVVDGGEVWKTLFAKEAERGKQLAAEGILRRLWRIPGRRANWGIWTAATVDELHAALASLPMFPHLDITVHPLAAHPNDPRLPLEMGS
jgi:muconolactone D-isomerase